MDYDYFGKEAKAFVAETESVVNSSLSAVSPRWAKFSAAWKGFTDRKKIIFAVAAVIGVGALWHSGADLMRVATGTYHSARDFARGDSVTVAQMKTANEVTLRTAVEAIGLKAPSVQQHQALAGTVEQLSETIEHLNFELRAVEAHLAAADADRAAKQDTKPITTSSVTPKKKKPAASKPSPSLTDPSSWSILP